MNPIVQHLTFAGLGLVGVGALWTIAVVLIDIRGALDALVSELRRRP